MGTIVDTSKKDSFSKYARHNSHLGVSMK